MFSRIITRVSELLWGQGLNSQQATETNESSGPRGLEEAEPIVFTPSSLFIITRTNDSDYVNSEAAIRRAMSAEGQRAANEMKEFEQEFKQELKQDLRQELNQELKMQDEAKEMEKIILNAMTSEVEEKANHESFRQSLSLFEAEAEASYSKLSESISKPVSSKKLCNKNDDNKNDHNQGVNNTESELEKAINKCMRAKL
jgi:hypothetical protein